LTQDETPSQRPLEVVEIDERSPSAGVRDWRIDYPAAGSLVEPADLRVAGWIVPEDLPVAAVELTLNGRLVRRAETGVKRPGVSDHFDGLLAANAGFRVATSLVALGSEAEVELSLRVVLGNGSRAEVGALRLRRRGLPEGDPALPGSPLVSVVIPSWNQGHYLAEAIGSVLGQTYPELELIVVDDGSRDNTYEVASRFPGVRCLRQPNRGVAAARNAGLAESQGAYSVFLDADDRLLPKALEVGMRALLARPEAAFAAGMPRDVGRDGEIIRDAVQPLITRDHYLNLLKDCYIWSGSSVVYRRAALEAAGGFSERLKAADDYELYLKLARSYPVLCHEAVVTEYRRHGSNTTRNPALVLTSQLQVLNRQRRHLKGAEERAARRTGIRNTRAAQSDALVAAVADAWRRQEWRQALGGVWTLARRDPLAPLRYRRQGAHARSIRFEPLGGDLGS
jgi:GT2 family glycosyltransferase